MNVKRTLSETKIDVKLKLAMLWTSFMFFYAYVDFFHLYMPETVANILKGKVFVFDISAVFLMIAMLFVAIPVLMIFLSVVLPAKANRWTNMITAIVFIPYMLFNLAGEAWMHMYFAAAVEVAQLCFIFYFALKWPRVEE